jgi:cobalamin synthase
MNKRSALLCLAALFAAATICLALAPAAFAETSEIGKNVGREVRSWATALLFGVAAIVGLPILFRRDVNGGLVLALLVIVVGGFVFAPDAVRRVISGLWKAIGG